MYGKIRVFLRFFIPGLLFAYSVQLTADEVILKDGSTYANVRTIVQSGFMNVVFRDGTIKAFPFDSIKTMKRTPVDWSAENTDQFEQRMQPGIEEFLEKRKIRERELRWNSLWRSAILPGWGQYERGSPITGAVTLSAFLGSLGAAVNAHNEFNEARARDRSNGGLSDFSLYFVFRNPELSNTLARFSYFRSLETGKEARAAGRDAIAMVSLSAFVYLFNLFDAYFLGNVDDLEPAPGSPAAFHFNFYSLARSETRVGQGSSRGTDSSLTAEFRIHF